MAVCGESRTSGRVVCRGRLLVTMARDAALQADGISYIGTAFFGDAAPIVIEDQVWIGCNVIIRTGIRRGGGLCGDKVS